MKLVLVLPRPAQNDVGCLELLLFLLLLLHSAQRISRGTLLLLHRILPLTTNGVLIQLLLARALAVEPKEGERS